ncbi:MAG: hypothetical protein JWN29_1751 [Acidimicrobiales bacterium]|nr:hypothetical protein [Acidimicrobiales bacterium]
MTPNARRLLRGYGPLLALMVVFLLMAVAVPTVGKDVVVRSAGALGVGEGEGQVTTPGSTPVGAPTTVDGAAGQPTANGAPAKGAPASASCPDRKQQVTGDPYSPPCIAFSGDNGGATSKGVTATDIVISARLLKEKGFQQTLAALAGADILDQPKDIQRTIQALAEYFNSRFQLYGRKLKPVFYNGAGQEIAELLGGGQAEAEADAVKSAEEIKAFAEINGATPPFADALARRKVLAFGTPYLSREWHTQRRPYNWSFSTDCSIITESTSEFAVKQLLGKPASHAGDGLQGKPRKFAVLAPENPWYQQCVDAGQRIVTKAGHPYDQRIAYKLDLATLSNQAASVIAKLKSESITTVVCGCDPVFPVFLTAKAAEQGYNPEWVITGSADTDLDLVGQLNDQEQWSHAFGVSYKGTYRPLRAGLGYAAYKTVRKDEPAFAVENIYAEMYLLALGIQLAGPRLTPETFEKGMFSYPGGAGPFGTWGFGPSSYTPTQDFRVVWWDPDGISPYNNQKGTYREAFGSKRFRSGQLSGGDGGLFRR